MTSEAPFGDRFSVRPLEGETWPDLERLFSLPGGSIVRGCWCMYHRRPGKVAVNAAAGAENRAQLRAAVDEGAVPGLVGYLDGEPVGWISLGPRADYPKLDRSPIMKPVDNTDVWSIVCTFVARSQRGKGLQHALLAGAIDHARSHGGSVLESYPVDKPARSHDEFMYFGSRGLYARAGFSEVVRRSPTRVVMRKVLRSPETG